MYFVVIPFSVSRPLQANKWKAVRKEQRHTSGNVQYILDGGTSLHRLLWPRGSKHDSVCLLYVRYVTQRYGSCDIVLMDTKTSHQLKMLHIWKELGQVQVSL